MDRDQATTLGLTLTAVGTSAAMMDRVLPPMHEIRNATPTAAGVAQIRGECLRAGAVALTIGAGISALTHSFLPVAGVGATIAWLWWEYQRAAAAPGSAGILP